MNIQAEHGKLSISAIARLYSIDRKSIYNLIQSHSISVEKLESPKRTLVNLTDIVSHLGEPKQSSEQSTTPITPHPTVELTRDYTPHSTEITPSDTKKYTALLENIIEELKSEKRELKKQVDELYIESLRVNKLLLEDSRKGFWKRLFT